jgi:hypothetical protein
LRIDEIHRAFGQVVLGQQRVLRLGDHVHDRIADRRHIEPSGGHSLYVLSVSKKSTIDDRRLTD